MCGRQDFSTTVRSLPSGNTRVISVKGFIVPFHNITSDLQSEVNGSHQHQSIRSREEPTKYLYSGLVKAFAENQRKHGLTHRTP